MNICIAMDSFKECMSALEACNSIKDGFLEVYNNDCNISIVPMSDGGEGTVQSLVDSTNGKIINVEVTDPLFNKVNAFYGLLGEGETAVIEMASASGLGLVPVDKRNPMETTTYGTGELILSALDKGVKTIILGIGGSATNDCGVGMATALGIKFLDENNEIVKPCGGELHKVVNIDYSEVDNRIKDTKFIIACDVTNPLTGENGASNVYGRQKGATEEQVTILDKNLKNIADVVEKLTGKHIETIAGAGAAGGLGAGCVAFLDGELKKGIDIVIEFSGIENFVKDADLVITGEGQIDFQSAFGKTPVGVAKVAKKHNKKVIVLAGSLGKDYENVFDCGIDCAFSIVRGATSLEDALTNGKDNLKNTAMNVAKLIKMMN